MMTRHTSFRTILTISFVLLASAPLQSAMADDKVGASVYEALAESGKARIVIALRQSEQRATAPVASNKMASMRTEVANSQGAVLANLGRTDFDVDFQYKAVPALAGTVTAEGLAKLSADPNVLRIDLDSGGSSTLHESVPLIGADILHDRGVTGEGVVVAVLDTGIDTDHSDLSDDLVGEKCFLDNNGAIDGFGACPNGSDRQTGVGSAEDDTGHGTHVSGIITSRGTVSSIGSAPDAGILAYKVIDRFNRFYYFSEIVAALDDIIINHPEVSVVNMSLSTFARFNGDCDNATAWAMAGAAAINTLRSNGVVSFASSGNNSSGTQMGAPACLSNVLSVGATLNDDTVASFSNSNSGTDIMAPGVGITSSWRYNGTATLSGTSMASPHAAGCAALLIESGVATTPDEIEAFLEASPVRVTDVTNGLSFPRIVCNTRSDNSGMIVEHYTTLRPDQVYEAESLTNGTGFSIRNNQPGYSHTGFADFTGEGFIEWTVYVPRASDYEVIFRYALGRGDRALDIWVDGKVVHSSLNFPLSGPWKDWTVWTEVGISTQLSAGAHTIRASTTGRNGPNIDYLRLDDIGSPAFQDRVPDDASGFGRGLTVVGDVNDDGVEDIAIGAPQTRNLNDNFHRGQITLHSGADGGLIDIVNPINNDTRDLGAVIVALGDVNNDGVNDFGTTARGLFYVYSGADRSILRSKSGGISHAAAIGDIDGDSVSEIALGAPGAAKSSGGQAQGQIYIVSGATGANLRVHDNPSPNPSVSQGLGMSVLGLGDVDGDDVPDYLAGAWQQVVDGRADGQLMAYSGANGALLYYVNNPGIDELPAFGPSWFGRFAVRLKDITGDSIDDFIVPVFRNTVDGMDEAGQAYIFSGADGALYRTIQSPAPDAEQRFGSRAAGLPDLNNDGVPDYAVAASNTCCEGLPDDVWYFYSGSDGSLLLIMEPVLESSHIEVLGDLNSDGLIELAFAGRGSELHGVVHIYSFGTESGPLPPPPSDDFISVKVRTKPFWRVGNTIDLANDTGLWVAIMSQEGFDPLTVDVSSVVFGDSAATPRGIESGDRNSDGVPDLILRYKVKDLSLTCGEPTLWVTGMTHGGTEFRGFIRPKIIGCGL